MEIVTFSVQDRPLATSPPLTPTPREMLYASPVRNYSFASVIEMGPLEHWVGVIWPASHPGQLSPLYQVSQEMLTQGKWRGGVRNYLMNLSNQVSPHTTSGGTTSFNADPIHSSWSLENQSNENGWTKLDFFS